MSKEAVVKEFNSSVENGLSNEKAKFLLKKFGKNVIKKTAKFSGLKIFLEQFNSFLIYILLFSAILMFVIGSYLDAGVIFAVLIVNSFIGFFQQYKSEKAIAGLKKMLVDYVTVVRNSVHKKIPSTELVVGDVIILNSGAKINADCRILESSNLQTNEAILTGESMPVNKISSKIKLGTSLAERSNMLYTGTQVVRGSGKAIVVSTGMQTEFGKIASKLQEIKVQKSPMQENVDKFSKQLGIIILVIVACLFLLELSKGMGFFDIFLEAVTLAIGAIPEGLPAVMAIAFSISAIIMSKKKVVIRKLPAVESLGSVTTICSDKTGTITEEKMRVQEIFSQNNFYSVKGNSINFNNKKINFKSDKNLSLLLKTSVLCNNARFEKIGKEVTYIGDPTEESLVRFGFELDVNRKKLTEAEPRIKEFEFDSSRKMMSILRDSGITKTLYSKGAPEKILKKCSFEIKSGEIVKLNQKRKNELLREVSLMEKKALRVLGFAYKSFGKESSVGAVSEEGLIFLGFIGMIDPPRDGVREAIKKCKDAGIKVKMITGDSALTASAIAHSVGIEGDVISQEELVKLSDEELKKCFDKVSIFARVTPEQKLRISKLLQEMGEIVAITGDGVNDVLALKSADVGIAMGVRGSDVSREVSDIVLLDDNFKSIVEGVREGRRTYDNIKKFIKYMLSVNFDTILLVGLLSFFGYPLPILPLQILWKNIVTDSFPALTLVFEKDDSVMKSKPRREKSLLNGIWKFVIFGGLMNFFACMIVYFIGMNNGSDLSHIRTMVVTTGIVFELLFVYTCRSDKPLTRIGIFSNKWLNYAILLGLALHFALLYSPLGILFDVVALGIKEWMIIIPLGVSGLIIAEAVKYFKKPLKKD